MKKLMIFGVVLSFAAFGCGGDKADAEYAAEETRTEVKAADVDPAEEVQMAGFINVKISVPTIQCGSCASIIKEGLEMVDGVQKIDVDVDAKTATVSFDEALTNLAALEQAIAGEGYDANKTVRDMEAYEELDSCCQIPEDGGGHNEGDDHEEDENHDEH